VRCTDMPFVLLYLAVEIVAVVALASWIGVGWTLLILFVGAVLGLWLARREGLRALRALAEAARDRRVAHVELTDGLLVAAGGLLLVVPGLVTDVLALLLLLPPTRSLVRRRMVRAAETRAPGLRTARIRADGTVVDGTVVDGTVVDGWGSSADPRRPVRGEIVQSGGVVDGEIVEGEIVDGPDTLGGARPKAS
jgi:UPF0716 protein FxsA